MAERAEIVSIASTTESRTWKGWLWDSADVSKEERRFLLKVSGISLAKGCLFLPNIHYL
jgi:ACS family pantothenate transporter-like MFS transporter